MSAPILTSKQNEYIRNANHRWNIKSGAVRSGKSYVDVSYVIPSRILERRNKSGLNVIIGVSKSTIERNVLQPIREIYTDSIVGTINSNNIVKICGEDVYCLGAEKSSQVAKIQGASIKYLYGDEMAKWNQDVFSMLKSRLDKPYSCCDAACNPEGPNHWLKAFIDSKDLDIYNQHYTIWDNPYLPKEFVDNLCKEYAGSVWYKRLILGEWAIAEGLVYGMFKRDKNVFTGPTPYNPSSAYYLSVDYGTMNPFAVGLIEMTSQGVVRQIKEKHYSGRERGETVDNEEYYKLLQEIAQGYPITSVIIDPSAAGMKATIRKYGEFVTTDGNNDVNNGIQEVVKYINAGYLQIHDSCTETLKEFESYSWDSKITDKDVVIKENDHHMDLIRYFIYTVAKRYNRGIL